MHFFFTWLVRLILLVILTFGLILVFFIVKDVLSELKGHIRGSR